MNRKTYRLWTITTILALSIWITFKVQSASAQSAATIIVDDTGTFGFEITIEIVVGGLTNVITFTPAATDTGSTIKKARRIADEISIQAEPGLRVTQGTDTRGQPGPSVKVTAEEGRRIEKIRIKHSMRLMPGLRERNRVNPKEIGGTSPLVFGLELAGTGTDDDFLALLEIRGPGGGEFFLNTRGLSSEAILNELANQINGAGFFTATVFDQTLSIEGVTPDNEFVVLFEDPEFDYAYFFVC